VVQLIFHDFHDLRGAFAATAHALLETDQYLSFATKQLHHHDGAARGDDPGTMER
jgi:hypothetical protein